MPATDWSKLPDNFTCALPDVAAQIPTAERARRTKASHENFLLLDGTRGFIRCRLPVVTQEPGAAFTYVCWLEVSANVFEVNRNLWAEPTTRALIRFQGKLANALPPFENEIGATMSVAVYDWKAPQPVIIECGEGWLQYISHPPGLDGELYGAILGEVLHESFVQLVHEKFCELWGKPSSLEELESKDWRASPRRQVIAEFQPKAGEPWRYVTMGLSSRPMPEGDRVEFMWEVPRQVTDGPTFTTMARIAAQPWRLKVAFFDGYVLPVQGGFPPGSEFKYALCYDATRAYPALADLRLFEQRVRVLMPLPIMEKEKATMRKDETQYLNLKDFIR
jgi:hypothetical protein